ncbi:MAG: hypothetical protein JWN04_310 [Myxococcaceae bacterium]|nr:hypothetical protein [Myxococcaceae bacterium]
MSAVQAAMSSRSLLFVLVLVTASGCMSGYAAPAPITPLLGGRGDVVAGATFRPAFPRREASAYLAAAPTESTRVYVAGTHTLARGESGVDIPNRELKERNHTDEVEGGGGWGIARGRLRAEILGGLGYGRVQSTQGARTLDRDPDFVSTWVQARGHFARASVQAQAAAHVAHWTGGGGVRIALVRFQYAEVLGYEGPVTALVPTFEPFMVQRLELPFGSIQLTIHAPIVPYSPSISLSDAINADRRVSTRLIETPIPRIFLSFQANLDELWRKRPARP